MLVFSRHPYQNAYVCHYDSMSFVGLHFSQCIVQVFSVDYSHFSKLIRPFTSWPFAYTGHLFILAIYIYWPFRYTGHLHIQYRYWPFRYTGHLHILPIGIIWPSTHTSIGHLGILAISYIGHLHICYCPLGFSDHLGYSGHFIYYNITSIAHLQADHLHILAIYTYIGHSQS